MKATYHKEKGILFPKDGNHKMQWLAAANTSLKVQPTLGKNYVKTIIRRLRIEKERLSLVTDEDSNE